MNFFINSASAATANVHAAFLTFVYLFNDPLFIGFIIGILVSMLILGFMLSKNPRAIPFVMRYSFPECFHRANEHFSKKKIVCEISVVQFHKVYVRIRILFLLGILLVIAVTTAAILLQK